MTKDLESKTLTRVVICSDCKYEWLSKPKRPNPRFITCPNCRGNVEVRESKLN